MVKISLFIKYKTYTLEGFKRLKTKTGHLSQWKDCTISYYIQQTWLFKSNLHLLWIPKPQGIHLTYTITIPHYDQIIAFSICFYETPNGGTVHIHLFPFLPAWPELFQSQLVLKATARQHQSTQSWCLLPCFGWSREYKDNGTHSSSTYKWKRKNGLHTGLFGPHRPQNGHRQRSIWALRILV